MGEETPKEWLQPRLITVSELKRSPLHPVQDGRFPEGTSTKTKGPLSRPDCNLGRAATDDVGGWNRERGAQPGGDQDQTQTTFLLCAGGFVAVDIAVDIIR